MLGMLAKRTSLVVGLLGEQHALGCIGYGRTRLSQGCWDARPSFCIMLACVLAWLDPTDWYQDASAPLNPLTLN